MNENLKPKEESSESKPSESSGKDEKQKQSIGNFIQDVIKSKDKNFDEILPDLGAANVFINFTDARSGGNYFDNQVDITGDIVGNNQEKWVTNSVKKNSIKEVAGQFVKREIEKISSVYIKPLNYIDAYRILEENHVLILWGNLHFGKRATAIHLISSLLQSEDIFEIDPKLEEEDLTKFQGENNQGYILDQLAPETAIKINKFSLNRLRNQLKINKNYLVITIDKTVKLSLTELSSYIISYNNFPNSNDLFKKHLLWYLETQSLSSEDFELIENSSVQELLQNNKLLPYDLDRLAELLSKFRKSELTFDEALSHFFVIANQQVESWFDQHLDLSQRTFMITLAVLNGSPYHIVVEASERLKSIIHTSSDDNKVSVIESKLSERLKEFSADLINDYKSTEYGQTSVKLIVFKNSVFQPAVLSHIWKEYDRYHIPLLSWLSELGSDFNSEVQLKASAAVGELCKYDFDLVYKKLLKPWANCENQNLQRLAALALSIPVFDGSLAPQVLKLLHHWSTLDNNPRLRWVATIAYGSYVGLRFPDIALRDLLVIAHSQDGLLFSAVVQSLVSLFEMGKILPNQYLFVLAALQLWTENTKKSIPHHLGLLTFWLLMSNSKITEESNTTSLPTLLWLAKENDLCQEIITCLVRRALNLKATRLSVLQTIHSWLELVSYDHRLYPTVGEIIYDIVLQSNTDERERIISYLKRWALEKSPSENAAWKILSFLKKHLK